MLVVDAKRPRRRRDSHIRATGSEPVRHVDRLGLGLGFLEQRKHARCSGHAAAKWCYDRRSVGAVHRVRTTRALALDAKIPDPVQICRP